MSEFLSTLKIINDPNCPLTYEIAVDLLKKSIEHIEELEEKIEDLRGELQEAINRY